MTKHIQGNTIGFKSKPKTTKICSKCGCDKMISFHSLNKKTCSECGNTVSWPLEDGQKGLFRDTKRD